MLQIQAMFRRFSYTSLFVALVSLGGFGEAGASDRCAEVFQASNILAEGQPGDHRHLLSRLQEIRYNPWAGGPNRRAQLAKLKQDTSAAMISEAMSAAAKKLDEVIVIRPVNPATLLYLERSFGTKALGIKTKTSRQGIAAGLLVRDHSPDTESLIAEGVLFARPLATERGTAVRRGIDELWVDQPSPGDQVIEILTEKSGRPITADIDVLFFARRRQEQAPLEDAALGIVSPEDQISIETINTEFRNVDHRAVDRRLIQHGPENKHPGSTGPDYPLTVFHPDGRRETVSEALGADPHVHLKATLKRLEEDGYTAEIPAVWGGSWK